MKNNYGNFVVQRAIKLVKGENKEKLMTCIMNNIERLGDKKIIDKWRSIVQKTNPPTSNYINNNNDTKMDNERSTQINKNQTNIENNSNSNNNNNFINPNNSGNSKNMKKFNKYEQTEFKQKFYQLSKSNSHHVYSKNGGVSSQSCNQSYNNNNNKNYYQMNNSQYSFNSKNLEFHQNM